MERENIALRDQKSSSDTDQDSSSNSSFEHEVKRDTWGGKFEFMLSIVGYTVGVGNIWRFPYVCYKNGGGAFLIPFTLFLAIIGGPLYYMEVCLGQFSGQSTMNAWEICPISKGMGMVANIISYGGLWLYGLSYSWIMFFLYRSFFPKLSWATCDNEWNTPQCTDYRGAKTILVNVTSIHNKTVTNISSSDTHVYHVHNETLKLVSSTEEFWRNVVLGKSDSIEEFGSLQWHLVLAQAAAWLFVLLCVWKGVKSIGKVVYVTVTAPYILLTVLLIRGLTLDGAFEGLRFYLTPDFSKLLDAQIWMDAAVQVFFSLGPAWGGPIAMASFNKFHHNVFRDTVVVCFADVFTAFYAGLVVFCMVGFQSKASGIPIDDLDLAGPGLAFVMYPEALARLPLPQLWSVLFFITLMLVGVDSMFGMVETVTNSVIDINYKKFHHYRLHVSIVMIVSLFLLQIVMMFSNGIYTFQLVDWYFITFNLTVTAMLECVVVCWIYGANRFSLDIEMMLGKAPSLFLRLCWCFVIPVFLLIMISISITTYSAPVGPGGYRFGDTAIAIGNVLSFLPLVSIPLFALLELRKHKGPLMQSVRESFKPSHIWKPNDEKFAEMYRASPYRYKPNILKRIQCDVLGIGTNH